MPDSLAQLLAQLSAGRMGMNAPAQAPHGGGLFGGQMPAGLLSDGGPPQASTPPQPTTPAQPPPRQPPTPPVLPFQGDPYAYGAGPEHQFFGGMNGQPYGLSAFRGSALGALDPTKDQLAQILAQLQALQNGYGRRPPYLGDPGGGGDGGGDADGGPGSPGGGDGDGGGGGW